MARVGSAAWAAEKRKREGSSTGVVSGSGGGRTSDEAARGRSMVAGGHRVSSSNTVAVVSVPSGSGGSRRSRARAGSSTPSVRARKSDGVLLPAVDSAIADLKAAYSGSGVAKTIRETVEAVKVPDSDLHRLDRAELRVPKSVGSDVLSVVRDVAGRDDVKAGRVVEFRGKPVAGRPTPRMVARAAEHGKLRVGGSGKVTVPEVRQARRAVRGASRQLARAKRNATPRISADGLNRDQVRFAQVLAKQTSLNPRVTGAWALAEQGGAPGDEYSARGYNNWLNVGPGMEDARFNQGPVRAGKFIADSLKGKPGNIEFGAGIPAILSQARGKSDREQANIILGSGWGTVQMPLSSVSVRPGNSRGVRRAEVRLAKANRAAEFLGLQEAKSSEGRSSGRSVVWPTSVRGEVIADAADHGARAFGNWMSDNALDIAVPVGTPVRAVRDSVVTRVSGSAPDHAANPAGWTVYLRDGDGQEYSYMHLDSYDVKAGDKLKAGEVFGKSGAANSVAHLHFAVESGAPRAALKGGEVEAAKPVFTNFSRKGPGTSSKPKLVTGDSDTVLKFQTPFARALVKLAKLSGEPVRVNEGFRSRARQEYLYAHQGQDGIGVAAAPGTSNHEQGSAADIELTPKQTALLGQVGLSNSVVSGEPWHVELADSSGIVDIGGSGSGGYSAPSTSTAGSVSSVPVSSGTKKSGRGESISQVLADLGFVLGPGGVKRKGLVNARPEIVADIADLKKKYG